ncbi:MAG TPA: hypothetical protein VL442_08580 [Mucilaginibacter sp.]|nr:hypothetical protein [Mucilaginibacter sp.]
MKKYTPAILFVIVSLMTQGCHLGTSGTWKNDHIQQDIRSEIAVLNKQLFNDFKNKDVTAVKKLLSPALLTESGNQMDTIINQVGPALAESDYEIVDEYYTKNTAANVPNTLISSIGDSSGYIVNYLAMNKEMYVSLLKSTKTNNSVLLMAIYGKYGNDWKINIIQFGEYEIAGKTAPGYYKGALKFYKSGDMIDAADMIITASQVATPGGKYFKYSSDSTMKNFYSKVVKEANAAFKFPITISQIKTKPVIFGANPQFTGEKGREGIYPMINYKSEINLADTAALRAENNILQKDIGNIFPGIDKNNSYIFYRAYNQVPDGKTLLHHYGFVQKVR